MACKLTPTTVSSAVDLPAAEITDLVDPAEGATAWPVDRNRLADYFGRYLDTRVFTEPIRSRRRLFGSLLKLGSGIRHARKAELDELQRGSEPG